MITLAMSFICNFTFSTPETTSQNYFKTILKYQGILGSFCATFGKFFEISFSEITGQTLFVCGLDDPQGR